MKRIVAIVLALAMLFALAACAAEVKDEPKTDDPAPQTDPEPTPEPEPTTDPTTEPSTEPEPAPEPVNVRVASLKGPTTMGIVALRDKAERGETFDSYTFDMQTDASAVAAQVVAGEADIALVPANLAAVLYKRTEGGVAVIDINTLGVLYCVTGDESIESVKDLAGKTVVLTGQGTTPEYSLRYLLEKNGVTDCELEFKSEATEVAAVLAADPTKIAVLPQP
ncbi:MAG: PhnD/SsuA/transferrin family substrate-binding protein, partial [Oscillospiraceae bacterium]|nr:PhnD/SsuA/transferrin family substrate-binding protein [Oscillospiraceae bacterium]